MDKILCKYLGGSHLYGLNGPDSDIDERGVFMNTDPSYILGLNRFDEQRKIKDGEDIVYTELGHFMRLLEKSNSAALETLFAPIERFSATTEEFSAIREKRWSLVDSEKLFKCLMGYMQGELRLALGIRKGKIGSKRNAQVEKYGFSPKNFTQLFRLAYVGIYFFNENRFIVDTHDFSATVYKLLINIKFNPENYKADWLKLTVEELENMMKVAFDKRKVDHKFNRDVANKILLDCYYPFLKNEKTRE